MSSLLRRIQRKKLRNSPDYDPKPQPTFPTGDGGYWTLRPTKGWIKISGARLRAQRMMAQILDR